MNLAQQLRTNAYRALEAKADGFFTKVFQAMEEASSKGRMEVEVYIGCTDWCYDEARHLSYYLREEGCQVDTNSITNSIKVSW